MPGRRPPDCQIVAIDPETFTEPVVMRKYWISMPGQKIAPYDRLAEYAGRLCPASLLR